MNRIIDSTEPLGTVETSHGTCELCACADAQYDPDTGRLAVRLHTLLRPVDIRVKEVHVPADWLPKPQTVTENVGSEEAVELARDVFQRWVRRVRLAAPTLHSSFH